MKNQKIALAIQIVSGFILQIINFIITVTLINRWLSIKAVSEIPSEIRLNIEFFIILLGVPILFVTIMSAISWLLKRPTLSGTYIGCIMGFILITLLGVLLIPMAPAEMTASKSAVEFTKQYIKGISYMFAVETVILIIFSFIYHRFNKKRGKTNVEQA